jgi:hypothetical protein
MKFNAKISARSAFRTSVLAVENIEHAVYSLENLAGLLVAKDCDAVLKLARKMKDMAWKVEIATDDLGISEDQWPNSGNER